MDLYLSAGMSASAPQVSGSGGIQLPTGSRTLRCIFSPKSKICILYVVETGTFVSDHCGAVRAIIPSTPYLY